MNFYGVLATCLDLPTVSRLFTQSCQQPVMPVCWSPRFTDKKLEDVG